MRGRPEEVMNWRIPLAALFVVLALTGCAPSAGGSGQARTAPYPQQGAVHRLILD
jgi:hypothetical protein